MSEVSVLNPIAITDAMLISSTAVEPDTGLLAYNPLTNYANGEQCVSLVTHRVYTSQAANNLGHDPTDINNQLGLTVWWLDAGSTNQRRMFDGSNNTQTVVVSTLTFVLRPGFFNAFYLGNVDAETIAVELRDAPGGTVIYSYSAALENSQPADWYEYDFSPFRPQREFLASGISPYSTAELTVTLSSPADLVKCGLFAIGDLQPLGTTLKGVEVEPVTSSIFKEDAWGNTTISPRFSSRNMVVSARLDIAEAGYVTDVLTETQDKPCLWVGSSSVLYSKTWIFGLGKGKLTYDTPATGYCALNVTVKGFK